MCELDGFNFSFFGVCEEEQPIIDVLISGDAKRRRACIFSGSIAAVKTCTFGLRPNGQTLYQYLLFLNWNAKYL